MKTWTAIVILGLLLTAGFVWTQPDRRGWSPANSTDPAMIVAPTQAGGASFPVGDCLPGTISDNGLPAAMDGAGSASMTVFTCRSRSGALRIMLLYLVVAVGSIAMVRVLRTRSVRR